MTTEKFHYEHNGKKMSLPHFVNLPFGVVRKLRGVGVGADTSDDAKAAADADALFTLIEEVADAKTLKVIDQMTMPEVGDLIEAWQGASKMTVGESSASSAS